MKKYDVLWKGILENLFDDFLRFYYPDADELFDIKRGFVFMDKELEQLFPTKEMKAPKFVDKPACAKPLRQRQVGESLSKRRLGGLDIDSY